MSKNNRNKRGDGTGFRVSLLAFALLFAGAVTMSLLSGCGADAPERNTPVLEQTPSLPDAAPESSGDTDDAAELSPEPSEEPADSPEPAQTPLPSYEVGSGTAAEVGEGLTVTVQQSGQAADDYFSDAVFVGDSRTEGLKMYSGLPVENFFSSVGLSVDKVFTDRVVSLNGQMLTVSEALQRAEYSKVYIMLGLNELGWVYESAFAEEYARIIDVIRESHPDAVIYVQAIIPVSRWKDGSNDVYTNANVVRLQRALCRMCEEKGVNYVNVAECMQDADGFLPADATPDGVHLTQEYYQLWIDYLKTHTV